MQLKDLPDEIQLQILAWSNTYMRSNPSVDIHLTSHLDNAVVAGMELEAKRHNSHAEVLWQTLQAFKDSVDRGLMYEKPARITQVLSLVDQCLIENRPNTIVP